MYKYTLAVALGTAGGGKRYFNLVVGVIVIGVAIYFLTKKSAASAVGASNATNSPFADKLPEQSVSVAN